MGPCQTHVILAERLCNVNSFEAEPLYQAEKTGAFRNRRSDAAGVRGEK